MAASGNNEVSARTVYDASLVLDVTHWPLLADLPHTRQLLLSFVARNFTDQSVRDARSFPQPGRSLTFGFEGRW